MVAAATRRVAGVLRLPFRNSHTSSNPFPLWGEATPHRNGLECSTAALPPLLYVCFFLGVSTYGRDRVRGAMAALLADVNTGWPPSLFPLAGAVRKDGRLSGEEHRERRRVHDSRTRGGEHTFFVASDYYGGCTFVLHNYVWVLKCFILGSGGRIGRKVPKITQFLRLCTRSIFRSCVPVLTPR